MKEYQVKQFSIGPIDGISEKALEVHLGLYAGYVKNLNAHYAALHEGSGYDDMTLSALNRRISFELAGVLNHELFFAALDGGPAPYSADGALHACVTRQFGSFDAFIGALKKTAAGMRGIGWVLVTHDRLADSLHIIWVSDHELGNVNLPAILAIDMWEHAYLLDYLPAEKGSYVDAYLNSVNWKNIEDAFEGR